MTRERDERTDDGSVPTGDGRVVMFVDGGLSSEEEAAFRAELAESAELRLAVARARAVRSLVSDLPRLAAPSLESLLEGADVESPDVARVFGRVPRLRAPAHVESAFRRAVAARAAETVAPVASRPGLVLRPVWTAVAAAALLLVAATALFSSRAIDPPSGSRIAGVSFVFDVVRARPGVAMDEATRERTAGGRYLRPRGLSSAGGGSRGMGGR